MEKIKHENKSNQEKIIKNKLNKNTKVIFNQSYCKILKQFI